MPAPPRPPAAAGTPTTEAPASGRRRAPAARANAPAGALTAAPGNPGDRSDGIRALQRGLAVLEAVCQHAPRGVRVVDLVRACGLQRATVHRLLATLEAGGHVQRADRFRYAPGPRWQTLAAGRPVDDLAARLRPLLARVSAATGDAAFAVVREGTQAHCIARHIGTWPVQVLVVQEGRRQPLGVGAAGLALLAALPEAEAAAIVAANAPALAAFGGMTPERLHTLLRATRERGWSVAANHVVADTVGVGCALPSAAGGPVASLSVAAPLARMPARRQVRIAALLREAVAGQWPGGL